MRTGVDLYLPFLLLALLAAVAEGLVVNPAALRHPGKPPAGGAPGQGFHGRLMTFLRRRGGRP